MPGKIDRDVILMMPREKAATMACLAIDKLQSRRPEDVIAGIAVAFAVMTERSGMTAEELASYGKRILFAPQAHHVQTNDKLESLRDFAGIRIKDGISRV